MSSINQYIDLLNANREAIDSHSAGALNAARQSALEALAGQRMPMKGDEDYEVTDLEKVFAADYGVNINRIEMAANPAEAFHCDVPNLSTCLYFLINDSFKAAKTRQTRCPTVSS